MLDFITVLGGTAATWPLAARAQRPARVPRLGVLLFSTPQADPQLQRIQSGLRELGYGDKRKSRGHSECVANDPELT